MLLFFGVKLLLPVILYVAGLLTIFLAVSDDSPGTSAASSNFLAAGIAFIVYTEFFDALLKFSKDDVGLAWIYLILISTLATYILKFLVPCWFGNFILLAEREEILRGKGGSHSTSFGSPVNSWAFLLSEILS